MLILGQEVYDTLIGVVDGLDETGMMNLLMSQF